MTLTCLEYLLSVYLALWSFHILDLRCENWFEGCWINFSKACIMVSRCEARISRNYHAVTRIGVLQSDCCSSRHIFGPFFCVWRRRNCPQYHGKTFRRISLIFINASLIMFPYVFDWIQPLEELTKVPLCSWVPQDIMQCDIILEPICKTKVTRECRIQPLTRRRCGRKQRKKCTVVPYPECKRICLNPRQDEIRKCKVVELCAEQGNDENCPLEEICYTKPLSSPELRARCLVESCQKCEIVEDRSNESNDIDDCDFRSDSSPDCDLIETQECVEEEREVCETRPGDPVLVCDDQ